MKVRFYIGTANINSIIDEHVDIFNMLGCDQTYWDSLTEDEQNEEITSCFETWKNEKLFQGWERVED